MTIISAAPLMSLPLVNTHKLIDRVEDALERIEDEAEKLHPQGEIIIGDSAVNATRQLQHFLVREQARRVARMIDRADERLARQTAVSGGARHMRFAGRATTRSPGRAVSAGRSKSKRQLAKLDTAHTPGDDATLKTDLATLDNSLLRQNLYRLLQDCASQSIPYGDDIDDYIQDLLREAALLDALWTTLVGDSTKPAKTLLTIASLDEQGRAMCTRLRDLYRTLFEREFGCTTALVGSAFSAQLQARDTSHSHVESLSLDGPLARVLAPLEAGTHLFVSPSEGYVPLVVSSRTWDDSISLNREDGPTELPPVLRIYSDPGATLDIRSRLLARSRPGNAELRAFILAALPPPRELTLTK